MIRKNFSKLYSLFLIVLTSFLVLNLLGARKEGVFGLSQKIKFEEQAEDKDEDSQEYRTRLTLEHDNLKSVVLYPNVSKKTEQSYIEVVDIQTGNRQQHAINLQDIDPEDGSISIALPEVSLRTGDSLEISLLNSGRFPRGDLLYDYTRSGNLFHVAVEKFKALSRDEDFKTNLFVILLPLVTFLVGRALYDGYQVQTLAVLLVSFLDIFVIKQNTPYLSTGMFLVWLPTLIFVGAESGVSLLLSAIYLATVVPLNLFGFNLYAEKTASWTYFFLLSGTLIKGGEALGYLSPSIEMKKFFHRVFDLGAYRFSPSEWLYLTILQLKPTSAEDSLTLLKIKAFADRVVKSFYHLPFITASIYFMYSVFTTIRGGLQTYERFYPESFFTEFFFGTGIYLSVFYLFVFFLLLFHLSRNIFRMVMLLFSLTLLSFLISPVILDATTQFKDKVIIFRITPEETAEPWVDVNISGRNFKDYPFVGKVEVVGVEHRVIKWSDDLVIFRTNPQQTKSGKVKVETIDGKQSNEVDLVYTGNR